MNFHIAPSILAADFSRLGEEIRAVEQAGAQRIHIDVMDGHFVPNLSIGPGVVKCIRPNTSMHLEVHLMIDNPEIFVAPFVAAGADSLIIHHEVLEDPRPILEKIKAQGLRTGLAINPENPVERLEPLLNDIDLALCMTVHPGFGGQAYVTDSPERIRRLHQLISAKNRRCELEVDGGINEKTAVISASAGANVLVIGTALFRASDGPKSAFSRIRSALEQAADDV